MKKNHGAKKIVQHRNNQMELKVEIKLSVNTVNQILAYLGSRPYQEVFQLIEAIQKEAKKAEDERGD
jgi:hypothetical protein